MDLLCNLHHGWLVYDLHAGDLGGREVTANTWLVVANVAAAQGTAGPDSVRPEGPGTNCDAPSTASVVGMRNLLWKNYCPDFGKWPS